MTAWVQLLTMSSPDAPAYAPQCNYNHWWEGTRTSDLTAAQAECDAHDATEHPKPRFWLVQLPYATLPMSMNDRDNRFARAKKTAQVRETAGWLARKSNIPSLTKIRFELRWTVPDQTRRDSINSAPVVKALIDGLVDVKVIPDDTPQYLITEETKITYRKGLRGLTMAIEEVLE